MVCRKICTSDISVCILSPVREEKLQPNHTNLWQIHHSQMILKRDSYMPCKAMALSTKSRIWYVLMSDELVKCEISRVCMHRGVGCVSSPPYWTSDCPQSAAECPSVFRAIPWCASCRLGGVIWNRLARLVQYAKRTCGSKAVQKAVRGLGARFESCQLNV